MIDTDTILYLTRKDVVQACQDIDSVAIIKEMFRLHQTQQTILPDEAYLGWTNERGEQARSLNMPGYIGGSFQSLGTKIINGNISNPQHGYPRASGLTLLHDPLTARPFCIMEGAYISSLRTASVTLLAAELLAGPAVRSVAVIGTGVLAQAHITLLLQRKSQHYPHLAEIRLFDLSPERLHEAQVALADLLTQHDVTLTIATSPEEAINQAQLVIASTTTTEGYIKHAWLQPGTILSNISLDDPLPEVVFKADYIAIDDWSLIKADTRRLLGRMYRQGQIIGPDETLSSSSAEQCRRIDAQLGAIITGDKPGRRDERDIILVNPFGLAIEDVAIASHVYKTAREQQLGSYLER